MIFSIEHHPAESLAAVDESGSSLTYGELVRQANLLGQQLPKRSLVFQLCRNTIGSMLGYVSFLSAGCVPLLLDASMNRDLFLQLVETYQPSYLWIPEDLQKEFKLPSCYEAFGYVLCPTGKDSCPLHPDLALLLTTSGSTGSPKLVRQTYKNIASNAASIVRYLELDSSERPITTLPMNYTYGLSILQSHLLVGATMLLTTKSIVQSEFWEFFSAQRATSFGGVPFTYEMLKRLKFFTMDLPSLRYLTQAGGKLPVSLHEEFAAFAAEKGFRFYVMYGQTEATARMGYLPYQKAQEKMGSMGIAIPGGRFSLLDAQDHEFSTPGITGELIYYGDNVTMGYATCREDLSKEDEWHGRLVTGDMAKMDEDGYFYITGRKKRFVKLFGNRVNLDECEQLILGQYPSLDCACVGVDEKMTAFITDASLCEEVHAFLSRTLSLNRNGFSVRFRDSIPKSSSGKTLYTQLQEEL